MVVHVCSGIGLRKRVYVRVWQCSSRVHLHLAKARPNPQLAALLSRRVSRSLLYKSAIVCDDNMLANLLRSLYSTRNSTSRPCGPELPV
jgi:hypothetical protein